MRDPTGATMGFHRRKLEADRKAKTEAEARARD